MKTPKKTKIKKVDKVTVLTTIYTVVDDAMKASACLNITRPGVDPKLTDAEVVTIAIYQEMIGEPREDHFFRLHSETLKQYFPNLNERSRYNRRKRDLWLVILSVRVCLEPVLKALLAKEGILDSAPVPCVGYKRSKNQTRFHDADYGVCSSKAMQYFGYKFHAIVSLTGTIIDFMLTSARPYDNQPVIEFITAMKTSLKKIFGDKAYNDALLQQYLKQHHGISLLAPTKDNQKDRLPKKVIKGLNTIRLLIETVNAQLQEQFHLSKHYAKSQWGLFTRIAAKITAHTIGTVVNKLCGRPPLAMASLAV